VDLLGLDSGGHMTVAKVRRWQALSTLSALNLCELSFKLGNLPGCRGQVGLPPGSVACQCVKPVTKISWARIVEVARPRSLGAFSPFGRSIGSIFRCKRPKTGEGNGKVRTQLIPSARGAI
jgi:hypothetical protein